MDPPAPRPPLRARAVDASRAGAFAAGGSLVALAAAISAGAYRHSLELDFTPPPTFDLWLSALLTSPAHRLPLALWLGGTLVSLALAVRFGHPGAPRGWRAYVERTGSAIVVGAVITAAVVIPGVAGLPFPERQDDVAVLAFLVAGALPLVVAWVSLRAVQRAAPDIVDGPVTLSPALEAREPVAFASAFALAGTGPPVTAEESERKASALEVRVLWGGDLLRVVHLEPPRSFHVGEDGADFAVDAELLGARRVPVVLVDSGGVGVVAPHGATGAILAANGKHGSVEQGTRIPLAEGARVSLTLPSRVTGTGYRAASEGEHAPGTAPLVLEIALVNAGRVVGRGGWLRGKGRFLASTSLVAAAAAGWIEVASTERTPPGEDDVDSAALYFMQTTFATLQAREDEEQPPEPPQPSCRHGCRPGLLLGSWDDQVDPGDFCETMRGDRAVAGFFGRTCERYWGLVLDGLGEGGVGVRVGTLGDDLTRGFERSPGTGQGFGGRGRIRRALGPPHVRLGAMEVKGRLPPEVVQRAVRERLARFRRCYENGLRDNANLQGRVSVRFVIGHDGAVTNLGNGGSDMPDVRVLSCVVRAFDGLRFPRPEAGIATVVVPINFFPPN